MHYRCRAFSEPYKIYHPQKKKVGFLQNNTQLRRAAGGDGAIRLASGALSGLWRESSPKRRSGLQTPAQTTTTRQTLLSLAKRRRVHDRCRAFSEPYTIYHPQKKNVGFLQNNTQLRRAAGGDGAIRLASGALSGLWRESSPKRRSGLQTPAQTTTTSQKLLSLSKRRRVHHRCRAFPDPHSPYHQPKNQAAAYKPHTQLRRGTGGDGAIGLASEAVPGLWRESSPTRRSGLQTPAQTTTTSQKLLSLSKRRRVHHRCRAFPEPHSPYHQTKNQAAAYKPHTQLRRGTGGDGAIRLASEAVPGLWRESSPKRRSDFQNTVKNTTAHQTAYRIIPIYSTH